MNKVLLVKIFTILLMGGLLFAGYTVFYNKAEDVAISPSNLPTRPVDPKVTTIYDRALLGYSKIFSGGATEFKEYFDTAIDFKILGDATKDTNYYLVGVEIFEKSADVFGKENSAVWLNWGGFLVLTKDYKLAEEKYIRGVELFPQEAKFYLALAYLYEVVVKPDSEIVKVYERGLATKETDKAIIIIDYAAYLKRAGNYELALHYYTQLSKAYPNEQSFKNEIANLQTKLGN